MTSHFLRELARRTPARHERRWIYVPYDQLTAACGPLAEHPPEELGIVMLESPAKARRRPYHKQKLAMVLANGRQFALEQAGRGVAVRWGVAGAEGYAGTLRALARTLGPLTMMEAAERELRTELAPLVEEGTLTVVPHAGWLTSEEEFWAACPAPPFRMDAFYRAMRKRRGWLMDKGKPLGGKWSHDADNRKPWRGQPPAPALPVFELDDITREVLELVERDFAAHPAPFRQRPCRPPLPTPSACGAGPKPSVCRSSVPTRTRCPIARADCFIHACPPYSTCSACPRSV